MWVKNSASVPLKPTACFVFSISVRMRFTSAKLCSITDAFFSAALSGQLFGFFSLILVAVYWVNRAVGLFKDSLTRGGFLGLGSSESLRFLEHNAAFTSFAEDERIYRRSTRQDASGEYGRVVA